MPRAECTPEPPPTASRPPIARATAMPRDASVCSSATGGACVCERRSRLWRRSTRAVRQAACLSCRATTTSFTARGASQRCELRVLVHEHAGLCQQVAEEHKVKARNATLRLSPVFAVLCVFILGVCAPYVLCVRCTLLIVLRCASQSMCSTPASPSPLQFPNRKTLD